MEISEKRAAMLMYQMAVSHPDAWGCLGAFIGSVATESEVPPPRTPDQIPAWGTFTVVNWTVTQVMQRIATQIAEGEKLTQLEAQGALDDAETSESTSHRRDRA